MVDKPLVVVESPTKVKTVKKYLGKEYNVAATVGHIKDLPSNELGIDIENDFTPNYQIIPGKQKVITGLKKEAGNAADVYLAPDPDREGEAIAWHTAEVLKKKGRRFHRVLFHELTERAIHEAMKQPADLDGDKYEAQQARRILDRLVGYQISPLLWRKVKGKLSAGRVQSVAVRIICERERAIQAFEPEEYWSITARLEGADPPPFEARLAKKGKQKLPIPDQKTADAILAELEGETPVVETIKKKTTRRNPQPPFTTSKLQQDANRKLRFSAKKTMMVAQQLYEGVELGPGEPVGLITYMRTDSTRISQEAAAEALSLIGEQFGPDYAVKKPRAFKNKKKAQDAHEAIRPTSVRHTPEQMAPFLTPDQLALYKLIWQRFVASQMAQALIHQVSVTIQIGAYRFAASGSTVKFPGFMILYTVSEDNGNEKKEALPELSEGMVLKLLKYDPKQHFTQPPPRFTEASLVKELEEKGIGRPSTYAAILSTIREKGYVDRVKGSFHPSELGFIVNDLLVNNFPEILDVAFTARMEDELDRIETADMDALKVLNAFYGPFKEKVETAAEKMLSMKGVGFPTELKCPECGETLHIKVGRNGPFLACNGYPACSYTRNYQRDEKGRIVPIEPPPEEETDRLCEKCGRPMKIKHGRYGSFLACSGYPECKHTESLNAGENGGKLGIACPESGCDGELVARKSKRGKTFYGCSRYPDCKFATWDKPVEKGCPQCQAPFLVEKSTKKQGRFLACLKCDYRENLES